MENWFARTTPAAVAPAKRRLPKTTLPAPAPALVEDDDDADFTPKPPKTHAPLWSLRTVAIGLNRADGGYGRVADLHLSAPADRDDRLHLPDLFTDLYGSIADAVRDAVESNPAALHLRKLQRQQHDAEKQKRLALARIAVLEGQGRALEIETPDGLAKKLRTVNDQLAEQRGLLADAEADLSALEPLTDKARLAAEDVIEGCFFPEAEKARQSFNERRAALLSKISEAVGPLLTELTALEAARDRARHLKGDVARALKQYLHQLPKATAEPATATIPDTGSSD